MQIQSTGQFTYFSINPCSFKVDIVNLKNVWYDMKIICISMGGHWKFLYIYVLCLKYL